MRSPILAVLLASLGVTACKSDEPAARDASADAAGKTAPSATAPPSQAPAQAPETPEPPAKSELGVEMTKHFAHATALEQAVIDGDLAAVATHAKWLTTELPADSFPEASQPALAKLQAAAAEAVRASAAEDLAAAAAATGQVVGACGSCHTSLHVGPKFTDDPGQAPVGDDSKNRMLRHQWAADRMREGMIGPSSERWQMGASAVSVAPPEPCPIESAELLTDDILRLREKIYEIGAQAVEIEDLDQRAKVYGDYLSTCAGCHVGGC